ncbi:predicted protein [Histoplasma mississippiense (nom. inval.)]|uniref:predicted protein n=1 Tax=Ajellomyces capsulatus (strain NAm1 / WU24) TaxID=2059318 RepID=UPI000157B3FF|nr:predicted protein [Histoplasma mississippiense (nom. inval.)]EDN03226.1 predicted protein [Histoplasma mississippiense (nom. inval.)]
MTPKLAPYKDEGFDPHTYTGGRWLRHDKLERDSRYIKFNFSALCPRVLELCPGAESITSYQKTEGGFNRVFIFTLSNAKRVVARLPFTLAGPSKLATTSEVATIKYRNASKLITNSFIVQAKTSIPIPPILDWSNDSTNSIGSEYIIMEHAAGVQLHKQMILKSSLVLLQCSVPTPDLHKRNIFVSEDDPSIVTGIIDWQSTSIEPAFCYRTWKDGAVALTHELIETSRSWKELGLAGSSPYPLPTQKELPDHEREYRLFVAAQNLKRDLSSLLNTASDGWVPLEDWEETKSGHREDFDSVLNAVLTNDDSDYDGPVKDEKVLRSIWPFDLNT